MASLVIHFSPARRCSVVTLEGETFGVRRDRDTLYDPGEVPLPLEPLLRRLSDVTAAAFYPLLEKRSVLSSHWKVIVVGHCNVPAARETVSCCFSPGNGGTAVVSYHCPLCSRGDQLLPENNNVNNGDF